MKNLNYNYIIFNSIDNKMGYCPDGYYTICTKDLEGLDCVKVINYPLPYSSKFLRLLYNVHNSAKLNKIIKLPFKGIWYQYLIDDKFPISKPICFVILYRLPIRYYEYLKNRYPYCKLVFLYRDLRKITDKMYPGYSENPIFDLRMTIDEKEAVLYNWKHFCEFESKIDVPLSPNFPESDVFFAGKAKDRLPRLLEAYQILTNAGLKCKYYLTEVSKEQQIKLPGITYADSFMSYKEMLYHTVNTRCILEINQRGAFGYTSRFLEAVMFNKRLITDNADVMKSKFYSSSNIMYISDINEIDPAFVINDNRVEYNYKQEFSPIHLIEKIDKELTIQLSK